ncbi:MAG: HIT domain-containing protein [Spirochaetales bacterium]|mgnify:CR=1|nr:HIT domain-containing protein [Spirochaetales bacterium]
MEYFFNFEKLAYLTGEKPDGCILCLIRDKSDSVENLTVYENETFNVSVNLYPYNPGHVIIFPLRHIEDIRELNATEEIEFTKLLRSTLNIIDELFHPTGINYGCNIGLDAGASIAHLHHHIIPRYPRETGIADLIAGKRILVENPLDTAKNLRDRFKGISKNPH